MTYPNFNGVFPSRYNYVTSNPQVPDIEVYQPIVDLGNSGATKTLNFFDGHFQKLTLTANCTVTLTALPAINHPTKTVQYTMRLHVVQGGAGSFEITWPAGTLFAGGAPPTCTNAPGSLDIFEVYYAGGHWWVSKLYSDAKLNPI
jgi:hypothetical protein